MEKYFGTNVQYTEFYGEEANKRYTLRIDEHKLVGILVESTNSCHREFYQRGPEPATYGLTINDEVFEKAVIAICQKYLKRWIELNNELWEDPYYAQLMLCKVFEKHLTL